MLETVQPVMSRSQIWIGDAPPSHDFGAVGGENHPRGIKTGCRLLSVAGEQRLGKDPSDIGRIGMRRG